MMMWAGRGDQGHVVIVGATNRPKGVEPALRRPGRLELEVSVELPDREVCLPFPILKMMQLNSMTE